MTTSAQEDLSRWIHLLNDPPWRENRITFVKEAIEADPELQAEMTERGQLAEARRMLVEVLAVRKLLPSAGEQARIDACADLSTLERWHRQAITAATVAEELG